MKCYKITISDFFCQLWKEKQYVYASALNKSTVQTLQMPYNTVMCIFACYFAGWRESGYGHDFHPCHSRSGKTWRNCGFNKKQMRRGKTTKRCRSRGSGEGRNQNDANECVVHLDWDFLHSSCWTNTVCSHQVAFQGTVVTIENFLAWKVAFDQDVAELKRKKLKEEEQAGKAKLTGNLTWDSCSSCAWSACNSCIRFSP